MDIVDLINDSPAAHTRQRKRKLSTDDEIVMISHRVRRRREQTDDDGILPVLQQSGDIQIVGHVKRRIEIEIHDQCCICKDCPIQDVPFTINECRHIFCSGCVRDWLSYSARSGESVFPLTCPEEGCQTSVIPDLQTKELLNEDELFSKFSEKHLIATGKAMYCTDKQCSEFIVQKPRVPNQCPKCKTKICFRCKSVSHTGMTCDAYQKIPVELRGSAEDVSLFKAASKNQWKPCPRCHSMIERIAGCNFMRCRCGIGFCYKCGLEYKSTKAARVNNVHGVAGCKCILWN